MAVAEDVSHRPAETAGRRRVQPGQGLLVLPALLYLLALLIIPIILIAMYSVFLRTNLTGMIPTFSWVNWESFLPFVGTDSPFWDTFVKSMAITLVVSVLVTVAAYPLAYFLAFVSNKRRYVLLLILLAPFFTSFLLRVIAWDTMLSSNGTINSVLWELGIVADGNPVDWLYRTWFSVGLVLAYSWIPFVALPIFVVLENMDRRYMEASHDLGASRISTFLRVTLPLSLPGVIAGFVFVLIPTTGEFVTPSLVGGADSYMFGQAIQDLFNGTAIDWNYGAVLAAWLTLVVMVLVLLSARFLVMDLEEGTE